MIRFSMIILFIPVILSACNTPKDTTAYTITAYFTSFDSSSNSIGREGRKFKYSVEQFNSDSNLIYQELYANPTNDYGDMWGRLSEKTRFFYKDKQKIKAEREFDFSILKNKPNKETYTYEYENGHLVRWLNNGNILEHYKYDSDNNLLEKRINNPMNIPEYYRFTYSNAIKTKSIYYISDTIARIDTLIYDKNQNLINKTSYNNRGEKIDHRITIRNEHGQAIEEKWREPFNGWRMREDGQLVEDEFYQINKYYYDSKGRLIKTEFYDIGKLLIVYEFTYQ